MGMAEQLLMAAAGGMAKEGMIPFATTYAVFGTRRAYDFIHQVIAEENLNVKICCALPGLTTGYGPSHQATEDIAMMRGIPGDIQRLHDDAGIGSCPDAASRQRRCGGVALPDD
jgi:transketolase